MAGAKNYWLGQKIVIIGNDDLSILYKKALEKLGLDATIENTKEVTLNGLRKVYFGGSNL